MEGIVLPAGLKSIGEGCFHNSGLKEVTMPNSVEILAKEAFNNCQKLDKIALSDKLKVIERNCFYGN